MSTYHRANILLIAKYRPANAGPTPDGFEPLRPIAAARQRQAICYRVGPSSHVTEESTGKKCFPEPKFPGPRDCGKLQK
jgi:hypothetical protein